MSTTTTLSQGPLYTSVIINFTAYDMDGDLNYSTAKVNLSLSDEITRENSSCSMYESSATRANFTCNITMWWFDGAGNWKITASIGDDTGLYVQNGSSTLYVGATTSFEISPTNLTWNAFMAGSVNQTASNNPVVLNNTGNQPIGTTTGTSNISINATDLHGETDNTKTLVANNFSVGLTTGGSPPVECNDKVEYNFSTNIFVNVSGAFLPKGNYTKGDGTGQEQLYFCLKIAGRETISQSYSTLQDGAWIIKIFLVAFIPARKKRKKGLQDDKLLDALNIITDELKEEYSLNKVELLGIIVEKLKSRYNINRKEILELIKSEEETKIPMSIFSKELGCLEAMSKYMKENLNMNYHEIAEELRRNERTIWTSYKKAKEKQKESFSLKEKEKLIPLSIFQNSKLTILEAIILHLKEKGIKYSEIGKLLNRDQRNIRTVYIRIMDKNKRNV